MNLVKNYMKRLGSLFLALVLVCSCLIYKPTTTEASTPKLNASSLVLVKNHSYTLKVSGTTKKLSWVSSNRSVVDINRVSNQSVKVVPKKMGTATVTARLGTKKYNCKVKVIDAKLNVSKKTLYKGSSYTLKVSGATVKKWVSNNTSIATVSSKGKVSAKNVGTSKVYAYVGNSVLTCTVTVKKKPSTPTEQYTKLDASIENGQHSTFDGLHLGDLDGYEEYCISGKHTYSSTTASTTVPVYGGRVVDIRDKDMLVKALRADKVVGAFYNNYIKDGMDDVDRLQAVFNYLASKPSYLVGIRGYDCYTLSLTNNLGVVDEVPTKITSGCTYCQRQVQKDLKNGLTYKGYLANTAYSALYLHTATHKGWAQAFELLCVAAGLDAFYCDVDEIFYPIRVKLYCYWVDIYTFNYIEGKNTNKYFNFSNGGDPYHAGRILINNRVSPYKNKTVNCQYKRLKNYNRYSAVVPTLFAPEGKDCSGVELWLYNREHDFNYSLDFLRSEEEKWGITRILHVDASKWLIMYY